MQQSSRKMSGGYRGISGMAHDTRGYGGTQMKSAYRKDILQTIKKGRKRFVALMIITVLGVTMFSSLQAACGDLRKSADRFFDQQHLYDLSVVSTLGLTQEDVDALEKLEEVEVAE